MDYRYFLLTSEAFGACVEAGLQIETIAYTHRTVYAFAGLAADKVAKLEGATEIDPLTAHIS